MKIERHIYIGAPAEKVWDAIVTPEIASRYFVVPLMELEQKPGGRIIYGRDGVVVMNCEVLECEPGRKLVHVFELPSAPEDPPTRVIYEVEPMGEMCKLTLIHDGFPTPNKTYTEVNGGWDFILSNLKTLLETGALLPPPKDW